MLFKYDPAAWSSSTLLVQAGISKSMVPAGRQQIVMYISTRCWNPMYMHEVCTQSRLNIKTNQHFFWTFLNNAILMCMHILVIDDAWASLWRFRHTVQSHAGGGKACLHDVVPRHRQNRRRIHLRVLSAKLRTQTETSETWCWYLDWRIPKNYKDVSWFGRNSRVLSTSCTKNMASKPWFLTGPGHTPCRHRFRFGISRQHDLNKGDVI